MTPMTLSASWKSGLVLLGLATVAVGQVHIGVGGVHRNGFGYGRYGGGGWWGGVGFSGDIGVTPAESYARGMAETMRAQGEAFESTARGMVSVEQARTQYIENTARWQEVMTARRNQTLQERNDMFASQRAARERRLAMQAGQAPERLSSSQFDRGTGSLQWPEVLAAPHFLDDRKTLEGLLKLCADSGVTEGTSLQIFQAARAMQAKLKLQVRDTPPAAYIEARRFLDLLANEFRA